MNQFRQGDVLLVSVPELPADAKLRRGKDRLVLAYGEATGHSHVLEATESGSVTTAETEAGQVFARIMTAPAQLVHKEHSTLTVPPGLYQVIRQREYQPRELPRNVVD